MGQVEALNIKWHEGEVSRSHREGLLRQKGVTLWFTGLSASGKSTIAVELEKALYQEGRLVYRLDGDNIRHGINSNLGFSPDDRKENIRRIGEVSKLFVDTGVIVLSSFISPYREDREFVKQLHQEANMDFMEVFVDCPLNVVEERDPKGLYKKARAGELKKFTGIDAPYERPLNPDIHLHTNEMTLADEVSQLMSVLENCGYLTRRKN